MSPRRRWSAVLLIALALAAGCGDSGPRAKPALSTPDAQEGIVYGKVPADPPTGTTTPFSTRGCQGCPPGTTTPEAASLAPGAQRIAFTRATAIDEADIWIADADGSGEVRLTRDAGLEMSPTWSPDGTRIAFVSDRAGGNLDLYSIATDGSGLMRLTRSPGDEFSPAWSPDGTTIAVTRSLRNHADIVLVAADGRAAERPLVAGQWASWMPDSRRLLVTEGPFAKGELVLVDTVTGGRHPLHIAVPNAHQGSLSPDGRTVAFSVSENGFDGVPNDWNEELWVARTSDGGNLRRLTTRSGNDHWPVAWAPDGKSLAWTADDTEGGADLYVARANGRGIRRLTSDPGYDAWPSWAPRP